MSEQLDAAERAEIEARARADEMIESYRSRSEAVEHRLDELRTYAGRGRRLAAVIVGSRAWDSLTRLGVRGPGDHGIPHGVERERRRFHQLARRADTLERGLGAPVGAARRRLVRRRPRCEPPPEWRLPPRPLDGKVDVIVHFPLRHSRAALRAYIRCRGRGRRVRWVAQIGPPGQALARAAARARGHALVILSAAVPASRGLVDRLVAPLRTDPTLGAVAAGTGGWRLEWADAAPRLSPCPGAADFPGGACIAVRREALDPRLLSGYHGALIGVELILALEAKGLATVQAGHLPVVAGAPLAAAHDLRELLRRRGPALRQRVLRALLAGGRRPLRVSLEPGAAELEDACRRLGWSLGGDGDVTLALGEDGRLTADWIRSEMSFPAALGLHPQAVRRRPAALREALVATLDRPSLWVRTARGDGDATLAARLCRRFAQRGHTALQQTGGLDTTPGVNLDAALAVQGRSLPTPLPGQVNLVWQISHPEAVSAEQLEQFDRVLVASRLEAERLTHRLRTPVEVMLQFTDPELFFADADPSLADELVFVGNWRGVFRRVVWDALSAGLEPALYGIGWRRLAPRLARRQHLSTEELRRVYSSCEILLADHWDEMRSRGFIANRLYDALACGAFIIADKVAGLDRELGGVVETYDDPHDLRAKVEHWLAHPEARRERASRGRAIVLEHHGAERRARQLAAAIQRSAK